MSRSFNCITWRPKDATHRVTKVYFYQGTVTQAERDTLESAGIMYSEKSTNMAKKADIVFLAQREVKSEEVKKLLEAGVKKAVSKSGNPAKIARKETKIADSMLAQSINGLLAAGFDQDYIDDFIVRYTEKMNS